MELFGQMDAFTFLLAFCPILATLSKRRRRCQHSPSQTRRTLTPRQRTKSVGEDQMALADDENGILLHEEEPKDEISLKSCSVSALEGAHHDKDGTNAETSFEEAVDCGSIEEGVVPDRIAVDEVNERRLHEEGNTREGNLVKEVVVSNLVGPPLDQGERNSEAVFKEAGEHGRIEFGGVEDQIVEVNGRLQHADGAEGTSLPSREDLFPKAHQLPTRPPRAIECNYTHWVALDIGKEFHDQYVYRHANGLCVIGLLPTHAAFKPTVAVTTVDFNVGKQNRADKKVTGKRKKNAMSLEPNSVLCKVMVGEEFFMIRCCVRGVLLEVNERLIKEPGLLNTMADTEGHIAIMMPRPEDWLKASKTLLTFDQYRERRGL